MALESYCAACTYLDEEADSSGKYYCSKKGYVYANDPKCYWFYEEYSRGRSARENMYENSEKSDSIICYLTTAMCNILKYPDDNHYLETLRSFRDNVLQNDINYIPLLIMYDEVGPKIAYNLYKDKNKEEIATLLFNDYIKKAVKAIENNEIEDAINIYKTMTESLAKRYDIEVTYIDPKDIEVDKLDMNTLGHARKRVKE